MFLLFTFAFFVLDLSRRNPNPLGIMIPEQSRKSNAKFELALADRKRKY